MKRYVGLGVSETETETETETAVCILDEHGKLMFEGKGCLVANRRSDRLIADHDLQGH